MKKSVFIFLLIAILFSPGWSRTITFVPLPKENPFSTVSRSAPLVNYLQSHSPYDIAINHYDNYEDILQHFLLGNIDLVQLGPLPMLVLESLGGNLVPVIALREKDGTHQYTCCLAVPFDVPGGKEGLRKLAPTSVALTQPLSTCGMVATYWLARQHGIDITQAEPHWKGNHERVALSLARKNHLIGGLKTGIAQKYSHIGVRVLAETPPLPGFAIYANADTLSSGYISRLRMTMLQLNHSDQHKLQLGRHGFEEVDISAYATVRKLLQDIELQAADLLELP
ncbi:PhnD/SsuA/transferrin family substrate-binding protein [Desulfurispira natronophila]|uniref:Phosphonate transport system substrate-binding protein n=1 Tax=Desulfurispira natronophila TaxID=682562 RepID=A0A7W8DFX4_9BACT|nr:PhnD/SsuA/transferrin family substrate-binding protein [Desulfurispira natronophila]MBB5020790.1 phosphonate transport system substrate-binding protein [Desulfurispira natronophila]